MTGRTPVPDYIVPALVEFSHRPEGTLTCPHCWTTQRATRNLCYRCAAPFHFAKDAPKDAAAEAALLDVFHKRA